MHEYSLASGVLKFCEGEIKKHPGSEIREVTLLIGVMSGVDKNLLGRALNHLKEKGPFAKTKFTEEQAPLSIVCKSCGDESKVFEILLKCPVCGGGDIELRDGQELLIKNIKFSK